MARDLADAKALLQAFISISCSMVVRFDVRPRLPADVAADRAKAVLAVGEAHVPAVVDRQHDDLRADVPDELLERAVQLVAAAFAARADDQVGLAGHDRRHQRRECRAARAIRRRR